MPQKIFASFSNPTPFIECYRQLAMRNAKGTTMKKSSLQPKPALIVLLAVLALAGSTTAAGAVNPLSGSQNHGLGLQTDGSVCGSGANLYRMPDHRTPVAPKTPSPFTQLIAP